MTTFTVRRTGLWRLYRYIRGGAQRTLFKGPYHLCKRRQTGFQRRQRRGMWEPRVFCGALQPYRLILVRS